MTLIGVPVAHVQDIWPAVGPRLARLLRKTGEPRYFLEDILYKLEASEWQLWIWGDWEAVIITQINIWPRAKEFNILMLEGQLNTGWEYGVVALEEVAKDLGCTFITGGGRLGWLRKFKKYGWHKKHCQLFKTLET